MPSFEYKALDTAGQAVNGTVFGSSLDQALSELMQRGLKVETIGVAAFANDPLSPGGPVMSPPRTEAPRAAANPSSPNTGVATDPRNYFSTNVAGRLIDVVSLKDIAFFFRQFATLQKAAVPMVDSFKTLATQTRDSKMRAIVTEIGLHIEEGRPMSFGMQRYPEVFTPLMMSLIRAGEEGGFLDDAANQLSTYLEQDLELKNLYKRVMFMPKLTIFGSIFIIILANAAIDALAPGGQHIWSPLTQPITWLYLGPIIVGIFLFYRVGLANPAIRYKYDEAVLRIPYLGWTLKQLAMARFGRAFGALYKGGVPIAKGILLAADACGNEAMRAKIYPAARRMEDGEGIFETLRAVDVFSPLVLDMVHTGEKTGNMDAMLTKMAEFYEDEAKVRSEQTGRVAGFLAVLVVGVYVLIVAMKFYGGYLSQVTSAAGFIVGRDRPYW